MLSIVKTICLEGLDGYLVEVETDIEAGIPSFNIVGLPDTSIKEAKERVKSAINNTNIKLQSKKILVNLSPADKPKVGTSFDLPIAVGVLTAYGKIKNKHLENTIFLGELSLNGKINKIKGILAICDIAKNLGIRRAIVPKANRMEAAIIQDLEIIPVSNLKELILYINEEKNIQKQEIDINKILFKPNTYELDFKDVKGQTYAKRALEIAASGGHNVLMVGSPGAGKSLLGKRIPSILPDLNFEEAIEITKIHSISGNIRGGEGLINKRPFRHPEYTSSATSIIGGGHMPKPGEISLAHLGVLFLDELSEFPRNTLEILRGPLEEKEVTISRLNSCITYPCNFMLVASMNPCKCGYYGTDKNKCKCSERSISRYFGKIKGPLLDRIDIQLEIKPVKFSELEKKSKEESSEEIKKRVNRAKQIQLKRYENYNIYSNSELLPSMIEEFCTIDDKSKELLEKAFKNMKLSARAYNKILKVARTIADLDEKENILQIHVAEAIQYRNLDRKYLEI